MSPPSDSANSSKSRPTGQTGQDWDRLGQFRRNLVPTASAAPPPPPPTAYHATRYTISQGEVVDNSVKGAQKRLESTQSDLQNTRDLIQETSGAIEKDRERLDELNISRRNAQQNLSAARRGLDDAEKRLGIIQQKMVEKNLEFQSKIASNPAALPDWLRESDTYHAARRNSVEGLYDPDDVAVREFLDRLVGYLHETLGDEAFDAIMDRYDAEYLEKQASVSLWSSIIKEWRQAQASGSDAAWGPIEEDVAILEEWQNASMITNTALKTLVKIEFDILDSTLESVEAKKNYHEFVLESLQDKEKELDAGLPHLNAELKELQAITTRPRNAQAQGSSIHHSNLLGGTIITLWADLEEFGFEGKIKQGRWFVVLGKLEGTSKYVILPMATFSGYGQGRLDEFSNEYFMKLQKDGQPQAPESIEDGQTIHALKHKVREGEVLSLATAFEIEPDDKDLIPAKIDGYLTEDSFQKVYDSYRHLLEEHTEYNYLLGTNLRRWKVKEAADELVAQGWAVEQCGDKDCPSGKAVSVKFREWFEEEVMAFVAQYSARRQQKRNSLVLTMMSKRMLAEIKW